MGLFSFFGKNKQESASGQGDFLSRSASESATVRGRSGASRASANTGGAARGANRKSAKDEANDPMLPEKKRARRRLIGAIALVLAMVIVLPMIFDSKPRPLADDIAIQIPSKDGGKDTASATKPIEAGLAPKEEIVDPASAAADQAAAARNGQPAAAAPTLPALPPSAASAALPDSPEAAPDKADTARALTKSDTKDGNVGKLNARSDAKTDDKGGNKLSGDNDAAKKDPARDAAKSKDDDSARAMAILEGKSDKADKDKADKDKAGKKPVAAGGKVVIQVAALATQEKIDELRGKLSKAGIQTFIQKVATQDGERTRIRVGPFATHEEANKMRAKINRLGLNATIVAP